jgi:hypothetical protein
VDGERRQQTAHARSSKQRQLSARPIPYSFCAVHSFLGHGLSLGTL